jgi:DNA-binding phage protein
MERGMVAVRKPAPAASTLKTERDVIDHLNAAFQSDRPSDVVKAFRTIADAEGLSAALKCMDMTRAEYREQVFPRDRPRIDIVLRLARALNQKITVVRI